MNEFVKARRKGKGGEQYVVEHLNDIVQAEVSDVKDTSAEHISGKDCVAILCGKPVNVEAKTIWNFLFRTDDSEDSYGTLPFELWKSEKRDTPGWLIEMLHPEDYPKAVRPDIFVFLLIAYQNVFCSIAFEDTTALIDKLKELATASGFDLDHVPCGDMEWKPQNALLANNVWLVSLEELRNMATITMIGEQPRTRPDIKAGVMCCPQKVQQHRYNKLLSSSRTMLRMDVRFQDFFTGDTDDDTFAIIDRDLKLLIESYGRRTDTCLAQLNKKASILYSLQLILENMLAHASPSRLVGKKAYFPISYSFLQKNAPQYKTVKTWFNHLKILIHLGLLEYFRPPKTSTHPVDIKVNQNNNGPDCVGYYYPVPFTRDLHLDADYKAQNLLMDHVPLSRISKEVLIREEEDFAAVDKTFGNDSRKILRAHDYVFELYLQTMFDMVNNNGYAFPEDVANKVKHKMKAEKRLWIFDETDEKEYIRQKPYWDEFRTLKEETTYLAGKLYLKYGPLTKSDKIWIIEAKNIPTGKWVIKPTPPSWALDLIISDRIKRSKKKK